MIDCADLDLQVEFAADFGADRRDNVEQEARAICQRAAVFVCPVVDAGAQELREQIAVRGMKFDAIEAGLARPPGAFERKHRWCDRISPRVIARHKNPCSDSFLLVEDKCRARIVVHAGHVHLPTRVRELHDEFAVEAVHRLAELLPVAE